MVSEKWCKIQAHSEGKCTRPISQSISSDQLLGSQNGPNLDSPKTNFLLQESYESFCGGFSFQNINFGE